MSCNKYNKINLEKQTRKMFFQSCTTELWETLVVREVHKMFSLIISDIRSCHSEQTRILKVCYLFCSIQSRAIDISYYVIILTIGNESNIDKSKICRVECVRAGQVLYKLHDIEKNRSGKKFLPRLKTPFLAFNASFNPKTFSEIQTNRSGILVEITNYKTINKLSQRTTIFGKNIGFEVNQLSS